MEHNSKASLAPRGILRPEGQPKLISDQGVFRPSARVRLAVLEDLPHPLSPRLQEHLPGALALNPRQEAYQKLVAGELVWNITARHHWPLAVSFAQKVNRSSSQIRVYSGRWPECAPPSPRIFRTPSPPTPGTPVRCARSEFSAGSLPEAGCG